MNEIKHHPLGIPRDICNEIPPLGLMPRNIWDEKRIEALCYAITRYIQHDKIDENVKEWIEELINFYPTKTVDEITDKIKPYVMDDYMGYFRNLIMRSKGI